MIHSNLTGATSGNTSGVGKKAKIRISNVAKRCLSVFLSLAIILTLSPIIPIIPIVPVMEVEAATTLTNANTTLTNGGDYVFQTGTTSWSGRTFTVAANATVTVTVPAGANVTINNTASGGSPFTLSTGSTLKLIVNGTLKVYGQAAVNGHNAMPTKTYGTRAAGGYAGIHVPTGTTLTVGGSGTLYAYGGDAGDGGNVPTGSGDVGAGGGGGAGAGIGGNGGIGSGHLDTVAPTAGGDAGNITIVGTTKVYAYGGGGGYGGARINFTAPSTQSGGSGGYPAAGIGGGGGGASSSIHTVTGGGFSAGASQSLVAGQVYKPDGTVIALTTADLTVQANQIIHDGMGGTADYRHAGGGGYFQRGYWGYNTEWEPAPGAVGGGAGYDTISLNEPVNNGGNAGKGGNVKIYTAVDNVNAYNGAYRTTATSQSFIVNNIQTAQTPIYAQMGYSLDQIRSLGTYEVTGRTPENLKFLGASSTPSNTKIATTEYGLGIGSGAGYIETSNGTVETFATTINLTSQSVSSYDTNGTAISGTFAQIAAGSVAISGVTVNTSTQTVTLSSSTLRLPYEVTGSSTTYNIAVASGINSDIILNNATINMSAITGKSAIAVASGANAYIELVGTNRVYGGPAGSSLDQTIEHVGTTGGAAGGAGINVPTGATLNVTGVGTLYAYGGDAGDSGKNSSYMDSAKTIIGSDRGTGGGGGAGAGIGGIGGIGGTGSAPTEVTGGTGGAAGSITINAKVYAYGGGGGSSGGIVANGDGGGTGGGGYPAAGIGGGGAGGGGGDAYNGAGGFSGGNGQSRIEDTEARAGAVNGAGGTTKYSSSGGGGYFSKGEDGEAPAGTNGGGALYGGGGRRPNVSGTGYAGDGGAGGAGGTIIIVDKDLVFAYNGSKITTSTSTAQGWLASNATPIRTQSVQGYGAGAGYTETDGTITFMGAPGAPTGVSAQLTTATANTRGNDITLKWTAPTNTGGTGVSLTGYTVVSEAFGINKTYALSELTVSGTAVTLNLTDMPSNTTGTFTVYAVNAKGPGTGTVSTTVTTKGVPVAPAKILVDIGKADHDRAMVYWSAPDMTTNNIAITNYIITFIPSGQADTMTEEKLDIVGVEDEYGEIVPAEWDAEIVTDTVGVPPETSNKDGYDFMREVDGLHYGTVYFVTVSAENVVGVGDSISTQGETASVTSAPTVTAERNDDENGAPASMDIKWTKPANAEVVPELTGFLVTRIAYDASSNEKKEAGKVWQFNYNKDTGKFETEDGLALTVEGTGLDTTYAFTDEDATTFTTYRYGYTYNYNVQGVNVAGEGVAGTGAYTFEPGAPTITGAQTGIRTVTLTWVPPTDNANLDIIEYIIYRNDKEVTRVPHTGLGKTHSYKDTMLDEENELANGAIYSYKVAAVNASGVGKKSEPYDGSTYDVPGSLRTLELVATAKDKIEVRWTEPISDGGLDIQGYKIIYSQGGVTLGSVDLDLTELVTNDDGDYYYVVDNLTQGNTYDFEVFAYNAAGDGEIGEGNWKQTTWDVPSFPRNVQVESVTDGTGKLKVTWDEPTNANGTPVLRYYVFAYAEGTKAEDIVSGVATPVYEQVAEGNETRAHEISGLETGETYVICVSAVNRVGEGEKAFVEGTAMNVPRAPDTLTATATGSDSVALSWTEADNNGSDIDYYLVRVATENGTLLTVGDGVRSTNDSGNVVYTFTLENGKDIIITYGDTLDSSNPDRRFTTSATVTGLEKGTTYRFSVAAHNEVGLGTAQTAYRRTMIEPYKVSNLGAVPVNESGKVRATWSLPGDTGEAPIIDYVVSIYKGEYTSVDDLPASPLETVTVDAKDALQAEFSGLIDGEWYTIMVYATNQIGDGIKDITTVKPRRPAVAPEASIQLLAGGVSAELSWINPTGAENLGGDVILEGKNGYLIRVFDGEGNLIGVDGNTEAAGDDIEIPAESDIIFGVAQEDGDNRTMVIEGLTMGTNYSVIVNAVTGAGLSANSERIEFKTWKISGPVTNPAAEATNEHGGIIVSWGYPTDDGDSDADPSTTTGNNTYAYDYIVQRRDPGSDTWSDSYTWSEQGEGLGGTDDDGRFFVIVPNLVDGQTYEFRVLVTNGAGTSDDGTILSAHPRFPPTAPVIGEVETGNASATITYINIPAQDTEQGWPANGGDPITGYMIYAAAARKNTDGAWVPTETPQYKNTVYLPEDDYLNTIQQQLTNVRVEGLENGVDYLITVRALNGACVGDMSGGGDASNAQYVRVGMPLAPQNLTVGLGAANSIVSRYSAAEGNGSPILYYHVYLNGDVYTMEMVNGQLVDTGSAIQFKTLVSTTYGSMMGDTIQVQVSAVNKVGESPLTEPVDVIVGTPTTPEIDSLTMYKDKVGLTWTEAQHNGSKMLGYKVYLTDVEAKTTTIFPEGANDYIANDVFAPEIPAAGYLVNGKEYLVQVTATNLAGEGPRSAARSFTFGVPQAPTIVGTVNGVGSLTTTFAAPSDTGGDVLTGFHVYANGRAEPMAKLWIGEGEVPEEYAAEGYVAATPVGNDTPQRYEITLEGLANGSTYSIQVSALNQYGESALSSPDMGTPATIAGAPGNVKAAVVSDTEATLTWTTPAYNGGSGITGYVVAVFDANSNEISLAEDSGYVVTNTGTQTTASISGLQKATSYYFEVRALTEVEDPGVPGRSNTIKTFGDPGQPVITTWTTFPSVSGTSTSYSMTVEWDAPTYDGGTPIRGYYVYSNGVKKNTVLATGNSLTINGLSYTRSYTIAVEAVNDVGATMSASRTIKIGQASMPEITSIYTEISDTLGGVAHFHWEPVSDVSDGYILFDMDSIINGMLNLGYTDEQLASMSSSDVTEIFNDRNNRLTYWDATMTEYGATADYTYIEGLAEGETYYFALASFSAVTGIGVLTPVYPVTVGAPEAPVISGAEAGYNSVNLTWDVPQKLNGNTLIGYQLYVNDVKSGDMVPVDAEGMEQNGTATYPFPVDPAYCGTENSYSITAISESSKGNYESLKSNRVKVTPWTNPSTPEDLDFAEGNATFTVTFDKSNGNGLDVAGYKVYWDGTELKSGQVKRVDNEDGTITLTVTGVRNGYKENGDKYPVYVAAYTIGPDGETVYESAAPDPVPEIATGIPAAPEIRSAVVNYTAATGENTIQIGYVDSEIITGETSRTYEIEIWNTLTGQESAETHTTSDTSFMISSFGGSALKLGDSYRIRVRAINDFGRGEYSKEVLVTMGAPKAPRDVNAIPGKNMATVTWTAPSANASAITLYKIYVRGEDGSEQVIEIDKNELAGEVYNLENGMPYTITVVAENKYGSSVESTACTVTPGTEPSAPASAKAVALNDTQVKVSWTEPEDNGGMPVTYYVIEGGGKQLVWNANQALEVTVDGLERGKTYTFTVGAHNEIGGSTSVATTNAVTTHTLPGKPSWEGISSSDSTIIAKWNPPTETGGSDIISYTMNISKFDNDGVTLVPVYTIEDIVPGEGDIDLLRGYITYVVPKDLYTFDIGTEYKVSIAAKNSTIDEVGAASDNLSVTVVKGVVASVPGTPTGVTADAADSQVTVNWTAPNYDGGGIENYYVYYRKVGVETYDRVKVADTSRSTTIKKLENDVAYEFWVTAANGEGESSVSYAVTATPIYIAAPNTPTNLSYISNESSTMITFRWDPVDNADYYHVFVNNTTAMPTATTTSSYLEIPAAVGTIYTLEVKALNDGGESDKASIKAQSSLNIDMDKDGVLTKGIDLYLDTNYDGVQDEVVTDTAPSAPIDVTADISGKNIVLSWTKPENKGGDTMQILYYKLYVDGVAIDEVISGTDTGYTLENVTAGKIYTFQVSAVNDIGEGTKSDMLQVYVPANTAPSNLRQDDTGSATNVTLRWDEPTAVNRTPAYYKIQMNGLDTNEEYTDLYASILLDLDKEYVFRVYAVYEDAAGELETSKTTDPLVISTAVPTPDAPSITATLTEPQDGGFRGIKIDFAEVENATGYVLHVDNGYVIQNFKPGDIYEPGAEGVYSLYVVAVNTVYNLAGEEIVKTSGKSNIISINTAEKGENEPDQVTNLTAAVVDEEVRNQIVLTWDAVANVVGEDGTEYEVTYVVYEAQEVTEGEMPGYDQFEYVPDAEYTVSEDGTTVTCYLAVSTEMVYYYKVSAKVTVDGTDIEGALSNVAEVSTKAIVELPTAPAGVTTSYNEDTGIITVTWNANDEAENVKFYNVYEVISENGELTYTKLSDETQTGTTFNFTVPADGAKTTYMFKVSAENDGGEGDMSELVIVELNEDEEFEMPPAPDRPVDVRYVFSQDATARTAVVKVFWKAPEVGGETSSTSNAYIDGYKFIFDNVQLVGENGEALYTYDETTGEYCMVIDCYDTDTEMLPGDTRAFNILSVAHVPVSDEEGAETTEVPSDLPKDPYYITYGYNEDTDGDDKWNANPDENNDGVLDEVVKIVELTGSVSAGERTDIPLTFVITKDGVELAEDRYTVSVENNEFVISLKVAASTGSAVTSYYDVKIGKRACTNHTITGIPVDSTTESIDLGTSTLYVGNLVDTDEEINVRDRNTFRKNYGKPIETEIADLCDLNGDGEVNVRDTNAFNRSFAKKSTTSPYSK